MLLRSAFDTKRIADATAHSAGEVLTMRLGDSLSDAERDGLGSALAAFVDPDGPRRLSFCRAVRDAVPHHDPAWMLQHGMDAFLTREGDGLVKDFDPATAWDRILREDMACG